VSTKLESMWSLLRAGVCGCALVLPVAAHAQNSKTLKPAAARTQAYVQALQAAVMAQWLRPAGLDPAAACPVRIRQARDGTVLDVQVLPGCGFDAAGQASVVRAVRRADPLPHAGFEEVFNDELRLVFRADVPPAS